METGRLSDKQRVWLRHVEACGASGLSMKAYAEQHGLDLQQFYFWKGRLKKLGMIDERVIDGDCGAEPVAPVRLMPAAAPCASIQLSNGITIQVPGDVDASLLVSLVRAALRLP